MAEASSTTEQSIAARLERLPPSPWHIKMRCIVGVATFFDAFDSLTIAYILPALIGPWHIQPSQIGLLISIGFAGQAIGALTAGWIADRIGRVNAVIITVLIYSIMSFVCAAAQDYDQLFWARFVAGIGLGGEVPIAAAYISEIAQAKHRGRFFLLYELVFQIGLNVVAWTGAYVVPRFGWQWMFIIGGVPAAITLVLRRTCPESPRWLASKGRMAEADATLTAIERQVSRDGARPLPPPPAIEAPPLRPRAHWTELFSPTYRKRTFVVWVLWACGYFVSYGGTTWLPSLYRTVYKLPVQEALNYSLIATTTGLVATLACTFLIDTTGRKNWYVGGFFLSFAALSTLCWIGTEQAHTVAIMVAISQFGVSSINFSLYLYTPELYPTRVRGLGVAWATFWNRAASILGPFIVGFIVPRYGVVGVFEMFAAVCAVGGIVCAFGAIETRGRVLEDVSP